MKRMFAVEARHPHRHRRLRGHRGPGHQRRGGLPVRALPRLGGDRRRHRDLRVRRDVGAGRRDQPPRDVRPGARATRSAGGQWGKHGRPHEARAFHASLVFITVLAAGVLMTGVDPILVTEFSVVFSAVALPLTYFPILVVANDPDYLGEHTNGGTQVAALIVGRGRPGSLLGFERSRERGPRLVAEVGRRIHRHTRLVSLDSDVDIDWTMRRVRVGPAADIEPLT